MKLIIDAMSGDNAPEALVSGCVMAAKEFGHEYVLVGKEDVIHKLLKQENAENLPIAVRNATEVVDMHDDPARVLRRKKDSSMAVAFQMLANGEGDAMISAGNTGAQLSGATLIVKRIRGIRRAALPTLLPCKTGKVLLIDSGANVECTPEYLLQFAFMGSFYMRQVVGVENPRVGLINNGTEDTKGDPLRKEAYAMLKQAGEEGRINFVGNVEGSDIMGGGCDVAVTDGFTGNVVLKTIEGAAKFLGSGIKSVFLTSLKTKLGYLFVRPQLKSFMSVMDSSEVGGAPFLGVSKPVFKAHGGSNARAIRSAVQQAIRYVDGGVVEMIQENVERMTL